MKEYRLSEAQKRLLREQVIDEQQPGPLLHDFEVVLDFVGIEGVKSSGKYNLLPIDSLDSLDERLARPLRLRLKRPQVRSHPYLMGLNLLLRASGLGIVTGAGARARLALDGALLSQWQSLNAAERYFNLLEAWLLFGRSEMVGEQGSRSSLRFMSSCLLAWQHVSAEGRRVRAHEPRYVYFPGVGREVYHLALMDLAGLLEVEQPSREVLPWAPAAVRNTAFGDALLSLIANEYVTLFGALFDDEESLRTVFFGRWQPIFRPYFPDWRENLKPPERKAVKGVFFLRVSLGRIWRRFAAPSKTTLDELVSVILMSVDFDDDHLYEFRYRNRSGAQASVQHPFCDEGPFGDEVRLGDLPLDPGQSMELTYDFGDNWKFDVKLERVDPPDSKIKSPRILESHGKAPPQYSSDPYSDE